MAEALTFANFEVGKDSVLDIGAVEVVGKADESPQADARSGVIEEIKTAFDYEGEDLGGLIGQVAPHKTLQDNIAHAKETLGREEVKEEIGYAGKEPVEIARDWGERSDLQGEVLRPLMEPAARLPEEFAAAVVTDGVANWINRMSGVAKSVASRSDINRLLLVAGARRLGDSETHLAPGGMSMAEYMRQEIIPAYGVTRGPFLFNTVELVRTTKKDGASVMARAARHLSELDEVNLETDRIVVPAVAGNWMQKGAQARKALQKVQKGFDEDPEARQLWVASHFFPLGFTGREHKASYQNPFSSIGNILRGAKLLDEV